MGLRQYLYHCLRDLSGKAANAMADSHKHKKDLCAFVEVASRVVNLLCIQAEVMHTVFPN